jgi:chemotaxis protein MotB
MIRTRPLPGGTLRWLLTYADMITLLLAFFVVMYAVSRLDAQKYQALTASLRGAFRRSTLVVTPILGTDTLKSPPEAVPTLPVMQQLAADFAEDLRAGRIEIERAPDAIVLRFPDAILFSRGSAEVQDAAHGLLAKVAQVLRKVPNPIEVEGHTDTLPISSMQFPSNWELSVARATAVVRELVAIEGLSPLRLSARGLGEYKPRLPNDPVSGEPRNRRVEIRILSR